MSRWLRFRVALDRIVGAVLLVGAAPVIAACAWRVRRHDGGPALVRVARVGRAGAPLQIWKLRTMRAERSDGTSGGLPLTRGDDPRVTPVGAALRRRHLDELPQLLNVVRGEMALLGPRPEAPEFVDLDDPAWAAVLAAPPGIAGPTQLVAGDWEVAVIAADTDGSAYRDRALPVKLAIDRWYVERANLLLDLEVVVALAGRLLRSRRARRSGAERLRARAERWVPEVQSLGTPLAHPWSA